MNKLLIRTMVVFLAVLLSVSSTVFADVKVLVIPKGTKAVFWTTVVEGALKAGTDLDIKVYQPSRIEPAITILEVLKSTVANRYSPHWLTHNTTTIPLTPYRHQIFT
ncbi:hypothetical protein DSCW_21590 [Desulfosarcina widdelii]|uniref:Uncharacterized protein n=1 Tax=Desulfosarcina widdelii TaxID=947919 RepID=A0A5K7YYH0_9BACT|nr:hypothetical protein [Desulfosarcina widdelii]BBO74742.1 hypothetical protein DSCW_21590 [Desulfosarcina widdelii]